MYIYISLIALSSFLAYFVEGMVLPIHKDKKLVLKKRLRKSRTLKIICLFPALLISAIRYDVGTDFLWTYYKGYERILAGSDVDGFEIGYKMIVELLGKLSNWPQMLIIFSSIIFVVFMWNAFYEQSSDIFLSVILVFLTRYYFISFNIIRQFMGLALIVYAFKYLYSGNKKKYLIFNLIAISLHNSLAICLFYLFIDKFDFRKKIIYFLIEACGLFAIANTGLIGNIVKHVLVGTKFLRHMSNANLFVGFKFAVFTFVLNLFLLGIIYFADDKNSDNIRYKIFLNAQIVTVSLCILINVVPLMERIYWQFGIIQLISLPCAIDMYKKRKTRFLLRTLVVLVFSIYFVYDIFILKDQGVLPYNTFWSY